MTILFLGSIVACGNDDDDGQVPAAILPVEMAFKTGLPVIVINTPDSCAIESKEDWVEEAKLWYYSSDGQEQLQVTTSIRGRGNVTWNRYPKKPYSLKLSKKTGLAGMKPAKRWVLLANWADRTLLRNDVAFECSRRTSLGWTPHGVFGELVLNGTYLGSYYLCEKIQTGEARLDIGSEDVNTGGDVGFLMEIDDHYDETNKFRSAVYNLPYQFREPDDDILTEQQFQYMEQYIRNVELSLSDNNLLMGGDYERWIDPQSFADWWIVNELCYNKETGKPRSIYVHKPCGERMRMGPVWDFDFRTFTLFDDIYVATHFPYLRRLFKSPRFQLLAKQRWAELRPIMLSLPDYIDMMADMLYVSAEQNIRIWPISSKGNLDESLSYDDAIERMKQSILLRITVIDNYLSQF